MKLRSLIFILLLGCLQGEDSSCWIPTRMSAPRYPVLGTQAQLQGSVVLRLTIGIQGNVANAEALKGNRVLANAAIENIKKWKFQNVNQKKGVQPTTTQLDFNYTFVLNGVAVSCPNTDFEFEYPNKVTVKSQALHWTP
jgi:TonB family protein